MPVQRHFLGWDAPLLPAVARWLRGQPGELAGQTLVVPTAQAGRRLLELLVTEAGEGLTPPTIVTMGDLPELLMPAAADVADPLRALLARTHALREAPREVIGRVAPHPPDPGDWPRWWTLAKQLDAVAADLAAGCLRAADVPGRCRDRGIDLMGECRWDALAELEERYHGVLAEMGLRDRQAARLDAIRAGDCQCEQPLVLIAVSDPPPVLAEMLACLGGCEVTALIQAPEHHAEGFDELGSLRTAYWQQQHVELPDEVLRFVDRPADQAAELVRVLAEEVGPTRSADQVSVGLGDERQAGPIRRALELAGVPARQATGRRMAQARPIQLLAALARFLEAGRWDAFAELLRHPDLEAWLTRADAAEAGEQAGQATADTIQHWITLLDDYASDHLQARVDGRWLGSPERQAKLDELWQRVQRLLPEDGRARQPLPAWSEPIARALRSVYGDRELARYDPDDHPLWVCLQAVGEVLREQARLGEHEPAVPELTASEAIRLTLARLSERNLPEIGGESAVELMGFLELPTDDAPCLVLTSMNEGAVPGSHNADPLLPNGLRADLGLADNARRYARDLMRLKAIVASRAEVVLIAPRRSAEGEPLAPSRLLLACDQDTLVRRVRAFYGQEESESASAAPLLLVPGERSRFLIPPPQFELEPINSLRVTGFNDYLACPYRFYLKHVLRLRDVGGEQVEMDGAAFGTLCHEVLARFGRSELAASTHPHAIADYLSGQLDAAARRKFGSRPRAALRLQIEQMRSRLEALAAKQAAWSAEGWRILPEYVEADFEARVSVDREPFTITGRIDRIDHHPERGYRIVDYKTGDTAAKPDKAHRKGRQGEKAWTNLQLPLYRDLCRPAGVTGPIELGYVNLPRKLSEVGFEPAKWSDDELAEAAAVRDAVIRGVRAQQFWPPAEPPSFDDGFAAICADVAMDRRQIIIDSARPRPDRSSRGAR
ncbi:MAG: PD-(D/E)XK nuclease family protein [Phycisphaeraceae bacterium]